MTDDDRDDWKRDEQFLDLVRLMNIGAEAIHAKRELLAENERLAERNAELWKLIEDGDKARNSMFNDMFACLGTGALKIDRDAPIPEHMRAAIESGG